MDSSLCLKLAINIYGEDNVLSLSFSYGQRHSQELQQAQKISDHFGVKHKIINLDCLNQITSSALLNKDATILHEKGEPPNTMVIGRNGLMARIAAIHAHSLGANSIYMGVIELDSANSGYRDCSRVYFDLIEKALKIDFANPLFKIETPLIQMNKFDTYVLAHKIGVLEYLLEETITCYEGLIKFGCGKCPACLLRNSGLKDFIQKFPQINFSYKNKILEIKK